MAKDKKSFVLYSDYDELFNELSNEDAGKLIKHIFEYVNDRNPSTDDPIIKLSFIPIKQQLKRDLKKYEDRAERSRNNGALGGRPKKPKETQKTQQVNLKPKKPDNVNDIVTVNDNVIKVNKGKPLNLQEVIDYFIEQRILHPKDNAEKFYHHYEANGWMRGKAKIKSWKSCVKTWKLPKQKITDLDVENMTAEERSAQLLKIIGGGNNG